MNASNTDDTPNSIDFEPQADSTNKPHGKPSIKPQAPSLDAWSKRVMEGTARMASDEEFRRSIASKLS